MRPEESFIGQPIRSLQTMLRVIAQTDERIPPVIPDGFFGPDTAGSLCAFQRSRGLPVTSVADQRTWDAIVADYETALVEQQPAQQLQIHLDPGRVIQRGERDPNLFVVQAVLSVLSLVHQQITPPSHSGVLDLATENALMSFQQLHLLPVTGELDKHTWKRLALQYPLALALLEELAEN